jgi:hypothetical protein
MSEHIEAVLHRLVHEKIVDGSIKGDPITKTYNCRGLVLYTRKELQVLCELCKNDPLPKINSNQDIVIQNYNDRFSIGYKAENDMILGHENKIVGSNTESMQTLKPRDIVAITDSRKLIGISSVERKATDEEANVWKNNGGRKWKNNYIVRPLTPVIKLEKSLNSRSGCCQNGIVKKLMKEILSKIKEEDN